MSSGLYVSGHGNTRAPRRSNFVCTRGSMAPVTARSMRRPRAVSRRTMLSNQFSTPPKTSSAVTCRILTAGPTGARLMGPSRLTKEEEL